MPNPYSIITGTTAPFGPLAGFIYRREQTDIKYFEKMRKATRVV
jgi:hypothetical protein